MLLASLTGFVVEMATQKRKKRSTYDLTDSAIGSSSNNHDTVLSTIAETNVQNPSGKL